MKYSLQKLSFLIIGIFIAVGTSYLNAWTGPTQTAPNGNVDAPVNLSALSQVKLGGLSVASLLATGGVGASQYCDVNGQNCVQAAELSQGMSCYTAYNDSTTELMNSGMCASGFEKRTYLGQYGLCFHYLDNYNVTSNYFPPGDISCTSYYASGLVRIVEGTAYLCCS